MAAATFMSAPRVQHRRGALAALAAAGLVLGAGCLAPAPRTLTIWAAAEDEDLTHDTPPALENEIYSASRGELRLHAALNETVAFQMGLRAARPPAGPLTIELSDLVGASETLAQSALSVYRVHDTRVDRFRSWYPDRTGRPATPTLVPDVLIPWDAPRGGGPLVLSEPRTELVWVDIRVPPTLAPGEYRGRMVWRNTTTGVTEFACELRLDVLPLALPARRSLPVICRIDPRDLLETYLHWPRTSAEQTRLLPDVPSHFAAVQLVNATMRLFEEHRTTPILWASFPKFRPAGERAVEVQWDEYDSLVSGWLDGSAFADHTRLEIWPLPASVEYPSAQQNGGLDSQQYARLLAAYLQECQRHFAQRGWRERAVLRLCPPEQLSLAAVEHVRRAAAIARQSETALPIIAHLPPRSLRGLGWFDAPPIEVTGVDIWAPPAIWFEPDAMAQQRRLGQSTWFMPGDPPYSGTLAIGAPANDPRILPWQAYACGVNALWIEHAAEFRTPPPADGAFASDAAALIYPADEYGLRERGPVASVRLKRLRRGIQDYELLRLLETNGQQLLAQKMAAQVVRWVGTDACLDNLLSTKEAGWPASPSVLALARLLMLRELAGEFAPNPAARRQQIASLSQWSLLFNQAERVTISVDGVRLTAPPQGLQAQVFTSLSNATNRPIDGRWLLPNPPPEWTPPTDVPASVAPGARRPARLDVDLKSLAYNADGVYPFDVVFDSPTLGAFRREARLAVAACPPLEVPPVIDGRLDDWPLASNNAAGDFRLCRHRTPELSSPTLPTQAFFGLDPENLYIGVRCALRGGEPPLWGADNTMPIDGIVPWGQDLVEILIDPRPTTAGTSGDLYCLQVKPSGLLVARKGCRTDPPMGASQPWPIGSSQGRPSGARVAVTVGRDAWVVELAIPLDAFDPQTRRNNYWGLNVTRLDARRGEYSSWSGARGNCYSPQSLGNLIMVWP